jgi:hypothetical protein
LTEVQVKHLEINNIEAETGEGPEAQNKGAGCSELIIVNTAFRELITRDSGV